MDYIDKMHKPSKAFGKITVLFILAILASPMFSGSLSACTIAEADIWAGHTSSDADEHNHSATSKMYEKKNITVYFYAECLVEAGDSADDTEDIRWMFDFGDESSVSLYTLNDEDAGTKTKTGASHSYADTGNYTVTVTVQRGQLDGSWTSGPGPEYVGSCKVTIFDVDITTPDEFPEGVCINEDLPLGSTVSPLGAESAGDFTWSSTGPGTVTWGTSFSQNPTFSANQAGLYPLTVEFEINDSPGGCTEPTMTVSDTDGNIEVVEVSGVTFSPTTHTLGGETTASATVVPGGRTLVWSIEGDAHGCSIDSSTGEITGGTSTGTITVRATDSELSDAYDEAPLTLKESCSIDVCCSESSSDEKVTETIETPNWRFEGSSLGFEADAPLDPITFLWTYTNRTGTGVSTNSNWDWGSQEDTCHILAPMLPLGARAWNVPDGQNYLTVSVSLNVSDNYGHAASDSHSFRVYKEVVVETTTTYRNPEYSGTKMVSWAYGTDGQNPQSMSFSYGASESITRSWTASASVSVTVSMVQISFGSSVGTSVNCGTNYATGISVQINGNTQGISCWRRRHNREQKGEVIKRDLSGTATDVGDVWVDERTWGGAVVVESKTDLGASNFHEPSGW